MKRPDVQMETRAGSSRAPQTGTGPAVFLGKTRTRRCPECVGAGYIRPGTPSNGPAVWVSVTVSHLPRALHSYAHVAVTASLFPSVWDFLWKTP